MSEIFYRALVQAILLYGSYTWVLSESMAKRVEGTHTEFLRMITGKRAGRLGDWTWETPWAKVVQEAAGTQLASIYIEQRKAKWRSGWSYVPYFRCVKGIQGTKEGRAGGRRGGAKRQQKNNFGPPCQTRRHLKG